MNTLAAMPTTSWCVLAGALCLLAGATRAATRHTHTPLYPSNPHTPYTISTDWRPSAATLPNPPSPTLTTCALLSSTLPGPFRPTASAIVPCPSVGAICELRHTAPCLVFSPPAAFSLYDLPPAQPHAASSRRRPHPPSVALPPPCSLQGVRVHFASHADVCITSASAPNTRAGAVNGPPGSSTSPFSANNTTSDNFANIANAQTGPQVPVHAPLLPPAGPAAMALDDPPSSDESARLRRLKVVALPPECLDGQDFPRFLQWWTAVLAQLSIPGLLAAIGGVDGATDPAGAVHEWKIREAGIYLNGCVSTTDLSIQAITYMEDGFALRKFILETCAPKSKVATHLQRAVNYVDEPRFRHHSIPEWFREIRLCLTTIDTFATANNVDNHASFARTEAAVVATLNFPSRSGMTIVPWDHHVAAAIVTAKCTTLDAVIAVVDNTERFLAICGKNIGNEHVSSVYASSAIMPSMRMNRPVVRTSSLRTSSGTTDFGAPLCPNITAPQVKCSTQGCPHRHEVSATEGILFAKLGGAEDDRFACRQQLSSALRNMGVAPNGAPLGHNDTRRRRDRQPKSPEQLAALAKEICNNHLKGKCKMGKNCYRKHVHSGATTASVVAPADVASYLTSIGWQPPAVTSQSTATTSSVNAAAVLDVMMRRGANVSAVGLTPSELVSSISATGPLPAFGTSQQGCTRTGTTAAFDVLNDGGSSVTGTAQVHTLTDIEWFPKPVQLTLADADASNTSTTSVVLGVGKAHFRIRNDAGVFVPVAVVPQFVCPGFTQEEILSAVDFRQVTGCRYAYKTNSDNEFYQQRDSGEMFPISIQHKREFINVDKATWDSAVPPRYLHFFNSGSPPAPASAAAGGADPSSTITGSASTRTDTAPWRDFTSLPLQLQSEILDGRLGGHGDSWGATSIQRACTRHGVSTSRGAAAAIRSDADAVLDVRAEEQRAYMATLFVGIPRPYDIHQAAAIAFHAKTGITPTATALQNSSRPLSDWAADAVHDNVVINENEWRASTGLADAQRVQDRDDIAVLGNKLISEAAARLPRSSLLDDLYTTVATSRGDIPGIDITKSPAHMAVHMAVHQHCLDVDVPFSVGHIIDLIGAPGGVEKVIKRVAQGLASAAELSPLDAEPPPPTSRDIVVLRTCLIRGPQALAAPASAGTPNWPVTNTAKKIIDAMPLDSVLQTLRHLPPNPVTPTEQRQRAASGGVEHNRSEVQYMRLRAARMGTYCWQTQHDVLLRLHDKLGHRNWRDTAAVARAQGYKLDSVAQTFCDACLRVKTTRQEPTHHRPAEDEVDLLSRWHVDVSGPHTSSRLGANRYATVFVAKGGTTLIYFSPNMLNFQAIQQQFLDDVQKLHAERPDVPDIDVHAASWKDGRHVSTDGAKCFSSKAAQAFWRDSKVNFHLTAPLTPALNGAAERKIRTLSTSAKCMLLFRKQLPNMWPEAWRCAHAVDDVMPTNSDPLRLSPFTQRTGKPPDLSKLQPAFCPVYVWQNPDDRDKSAPGARKGCYIGHCQLTDCPRVLIDGDTRASVVTSRHIRVVTDLPSTLTESLVLTQYHAIDHDADSDLETLDIDQILEEQRHPDPDTINLDYYGSSGVSYSVPQPVLSTTFFSALADLDSAIGQHPIIGKVSSARNTTLPTVVDTTLSPDDVLWLAGFSAKTRGDDPDLHYNYSSAKRCDKFGHLVEAAAIKELTGLLRDKGCLEQVLLGDIADDDPRIHRCLPLFHPKYKNTAEDDDDSTAVFDRYKCRITFNGSSQIQGIDYLRSETNQPRFESWRLHMGTICGATVGPDGHYVPPVDPDENFTLGGDVPMAYTNATPTSTVLVELPRDVYHLALRHGLVKKDPSGRCVCRVLKCQYGQCDAGRLWENVWVDDMLARGFTQSAYERCLFYRGDIRVLCHTDDFLARGNKAQCLAFAAEMDERWGDCKCTPFPKEILSWNISYGKHNAITLSALGQINGMLKSLDMESTFRRYTPMPSNADPSCWKSSEHCGVTKIVQSMNGSLNHIAQTTRPDMSFACNKFGRCQYMPSTAVIPSLRHSYKYMQTTKHWGLSFDAPFSNPGSGTNVLQVWVDASDGDCEENRSQTGFLLGFNGGAVDWGSHVQKTTSLCTGESELKASCKAARSAVFMIKLISEFGYPPVNPVTMHEDNTTAIKWSLPDGPSLSDKNKHVDRQYFFVQQLQTQDPPLINMVHCPTDLQRADLLTKNLGRVVHNRLCDMIFVDTSTKS